MFVEYATRIRDYFGLPDDTHPGPFKAQVEAADAAEQAANGKFSHGAPR